MNKENNKRKLVASAAMAVASIALLMGLTFAWFTDSVTNKGNAIQAGTLGITATVAPVEAGKADFTIAGINGGKPFGFSATAQDLEAEGVHAIAENNWEPGQSNAKLLTVANNGSLAAKVKLQFAIEDGGLADALWFDFIMVKDGQAAGAFQKRPMGELANLANSLELPVAPGAQTQFILVYGMNESAGNEFQGKAFTADATVLATQDTVETDGFGNNQYDAGATMPVVSTESLLESLAAMQPGGALALGGDVHVPYDGSEGTIGELNIAKDGTLDLAGKTLTLDFMEGVIQGENATLCNGIVTATNGHYPLFIGNGAPTSVLLENLVVTRGGINVYNATATLRNVTVDASTRSYYAIWADNGGIVTVESGSYIGGAGGAVNCAKQGTVYINGGTFDGGRGSAINAGAAGTIVIKGGTFSSDPSKHVAEGYTVTEQTVDGKTWFVVNPA